MSITGLIIPFFKEGWEFKEPRQCSFSALLGILLASAGALVKADIFIVIEALGLCAFSGVIPVTSRLGQMKVMHRRSRNKKLQTTFCLLAKNTLSIHDPKMRAMFTKHRARGKRERVSCDAPNDNQDIIMWDDQNENLIPSGMSLPHLFLVKQTSSEKDAFSV